MGRKDWYYVHLPKLLIKRLDQFLQTPRAKSMGMSSKPELLRHVINQFLDERVPTKLIEQGRYEDPLQLENMSNEAIKGFEMPITVLCLYKAVPENLEDRFSEYHDLIIKRAASSESLR